MPSKPQTKLESTPIPTVFLDRDGVLLFDHGPLAKKQDIQIHPKAPQALARLKSQGILLIVISNQTAIARGLVSEQGAEELQRAIETKLRHLGAPALDGHFFCLHHPRANLPAYRANCHCRKPEIGLFQRAQALHHIDLRRSFMVGDRPSDITAGNRAGCRTILVRTGRHEDPLIQTTKAFSATSPDYMCDHLGQAANLIIGELD
jgi:D-glycero-D-manno-heptose 1,7-bisphosphate phosphatase